MDYGNISEIWTALFTAGTFFTSAMLVAVAITQINSARDENRKTQTLAACGRYDTDPIVYACHAKLVDAKEGKARNDKALEDKAVSLRLEIITVLNFLDAIAIGVGQGLYINELAKAHLSPIVRRHVSELIESDVLNRLECPRECFEHLIALDKSWQSEQGDSECPAPPRAYYASAKTLSPAA